MQVRLSQSGPAPVGAVRRKALHVGVAILACAGVVPAQAETISSALTRAYGNNPDLNQQRAATRAVAFASA